MTASKKNMVPVWVDPDEIPDTSTPYWQKIIDATPISRGRPRIPDPKLSTTLRLDADILTKFKEGGPGWQTRINEVLKEYLARK
jgi:uncharacterized protein (DUF4415 family)